MFTLTEYSFYKGENISKLFDNFSAPVLGTRIDRSGLEPWPLDATENRDRCGPNRPH